MPGEALGIDKTIWKSAEDEDYACKLYIIRILCTEICGEHQSVIIPEAENMGEAHVADEMTADHPESLVEIQIFKISREIPVYNI